jgi:hypothetical protein
MYKDIYQISHFSDINHRIDIIVALNHCQSSVFTCKQNTLNQQNKTFNNLNKGICRVQRDTQGFQYFTSQPVLHY